MGVYVCIKYQSTRRGQEQGKKKKKANQTNL